MNKVHIGKNKSLVSYANTNIELNSILSIFMVYVKSVKHCIIERINFVVKIPR